MRATYQLPALWDLHLDGDLLEELVVERVGAVQLQHHVTRVHVLDHLQQINIFSSTEGTLETHENGGHFVCKSRN